MSFASKHIAPTVKHTYVMQGGAYKTWKIRGMFPLRV
jgi:hypothetical protein